MDTLADIRAVLGAARERIDRGLVREDPQAFLDALWTRVYDPAPPDLQPYVWSRLVDFSAQLGVLVESRTLEQHPAPHYHHH